MSLLFDPSPDLTHKMLQVNFVVMDVDGTITSADDQTALNVSQVLGRLDYAGVRWSFATGRSIAGLLATTSNILGRQRVKAIPPAICYNGAVTYAPGTPSVLNIKTMRVEDVREVLDIGRQLRLPVSVYTCVSILGMPNETVYTNIRARHKTPDINSMPYQYIENWDLLDLSGAVAVLLEVAPGRAKTEFSDIKNAISPSITVTSSGGSFYEFTSAGTSKAAALEQMIQDIHELGGSFKTWKRFSAITTATTMAIGDSLNDVEMLRTAGVAVAVSNSLDEVKAAADIVTGLAAGQGAVEALRYLLDIKRYRSTDANK